MAAGACVLGLVFTFAIVLPAPRATWSLGADLYLGRVENPQWRGGRVDAKMFLYLVGAVMLELNLLSFAAHHLLAHRGRSVARRASLRRRCSASSSSSTSSFERVHLYTYDFVAERVGFKLGWGCLVLLSVLLLRRACGRSPSGPTRTRQRCAAALVAAHLLRRLDALARRQPAEVLLQDAIPRGQAFGPDRARARCRRQAACWCSGFWGLSRHINYLGELLMAIGADARLGYPARSGRGSIRSTTWRCWCRGSSTTTAAARRSTARCGRTIAGGALAHRSLHLLIHTSSGRRCLVDW